MLPELHSILKLLEGGFGRLKVLVVGDTMVDRYIMGDVDRISPEAPVPVLRHVQRYERAGGAASLARCARFYLFIAPAGHQCLPVDGSGPGRRGAD